MSSFLPLLPASALNASSMLYKSLVFDARIAGVITSTLVLDHCLIHCFKIPSTGGMKNRSMTIVDVLRCFFYSMVSFATISLHMGFTIANRTAYSFEWPSLLQLAIYVPVTLAVQDLYHYFVHRWIHSSSCPRWIRNIHAPHHRDIHPTTGMLTTDLMAANPTEYWITVLPSLSILFEMYLLFPNPNFPAYAISNWVATILVGFGHGNSEIPFPKLWSVLGYGKTSFHTMHHYNPTKNFSIYSTWLDRLFGTYQPYVEQQSKQT